MLQSTKHKKDTIDLSSAPWTMHEFFAGSGLVHSMRISSTSPVLGFFHI